jgi:transcriptional regulator with XRE-family HTH domain
MTLRDYLKANKISRAAFAEAMGVHVISVSRWATGSRTPDLRTMQAIVSRTEGSVQPADFFKPVCDGHSDASQAA